MIHTGHYRLNLSWGPCHPNVGWSVGRGRFDRKDNVDGNGNVDLLLTLDRDLGVYGRHARLSHVLDSNAFIVIADRSLKVDYKRIQGSQIAAFDRKSTHILFGQLEYALEFTTIDQNVYRKQLDKLAVETNFVGLRPASYMNPTPAETDYSIRHYSVRSAIAAGSSGFVCFAVDKTTGHQVAMKKIITKGPRAVEDVTREVDAMRRLTEQSPPVSSINLAPSYSLIANIEQSSIVSLVDSFFCAAPDTPGLGEAFIVSTPLIHTTLDKWITSPLPLASRLLLFEQMLEGLAFLHKNGCMHRDIKCQNILASAQPLQAVIIDFGAATWDDTSTDHRPGTLKYSAPEIIAMKRDDASVGLNYDKSVDVWAMGLSALQLITSIRFNWNNVSTSNYEKLKATTGPRLSPQHSGWAGSIIKDMIMWDPKDRISAEDAYGRIPRPEESDVTPHSNKRGKMIAE